jgi:uncharacterized membrane protein
MSSELSNYSAEPRSSLVSLTYLIYGLHLFSVVVGVTTSALIVTSYLSNLPSIVAVILNYVKRGDTRGTYLESHFRWQIRTFWFSLLWLAISGLLFITIIGIPAAWLIIVFVGVWVAYRMLRGVLRLLDEQPMPMD